jgi:immune inhibitor A
MFCKPFCFYERETTNLFKGPLTWKWERPKRQVKLPEASTMPSANWIRRLLGMLLLVVASGELLAVPAPGIKQVLTQPDGTSFTAHQWGDEWSHGWETGEGYSIVRSTADGRWYYAITANNGALVASKRLVTGAPPMKMQQHLRPSGSVRAKAAALRASSAGPQPIVPPTGTANVPVLMMNFNDTAYTYSPNDYQQMLFGSNNRSMKDFYEENSFGTFSVSAGPSGVLGWGHASHDHDYYGEMTFFMTDSHPASLVIESIEQADPYIDFADYDADGDCIVDVVAVIHQGDGQEFSGNPNDIWSHRWSLENAQRAGDGTGPYVTNDTAACGNLIVNDYIMMPETQGGDISTMGVFAHEYGHSLGLPDLYDTDHSSAGIGAWGLMAAGSWNQVNRAGDSPSHLSAWSKYFLGWLKPRPVHGSLAKVNIPPVEQRAVAYRFGEGSPSKGGEYYLIENRQQLGFDAGLPGKGLAVWHIDESKATSDNSDNSQECIGTTNCSGRNYRVALVQADGEWDLERTSAAGGDQGDLFPGTSGNTSISGNSTPDSDWYNGSDSSMALSNIMLSGTNVLTNLSFGGGVEGSLDLRVNGSDGPLTLRQGEPMVITLSVVAGQYAGLVVDWKLSAKTPMGPFYYDYATNSWKAGSGISFHGPVVDVDSFEALNNSTLPSGNYLITLFLGNGANGVSDEVAVRVQ